MDDISCRLDYIEEETSRVVKEIYRGIALVGIVSVLALFLAIAGIALAVLK